MVSKIFGCCVYILGFLSVLISAIPKSLKFLGKLVNILIIKLFSQKDGLVTVKCVLLENNMQKDFTVIDVSNNNKLSDIESLFDQSDKQSTDDSQNDSQDNEQYNVLEILVNVNYQRKIIAIPIKREYKSMMAGMLSLVCGDVTKNHFNDLTNLQVEDASITIGAKKFGGNNIDNFASSYGHLILSDSIQDKLQLFNLSYIEGINNQDLTMPISELNVLDNNAKHHSIKK